ncbi:protein methyltransferase [Saccharata proteae CBS 121410]|uniref:Protein methyltransferase n=1 Tax=Saccharata proteae CBS 121410 TaxID=1314787 RepID=A0A9P4HQ97_9PEZI|nr:protein methyltransferase [Saccharata proteae CBS 121410]
MSGSTRASHHHVALRRCPDLVLVLDTPKGRGVFAAQDIPARTVIETCPALVLGIEENEEHIRHTSLYHYTYNWPVRDAEGKMKTAQAVIFGLGSMFNHARDQNVGWDRDVSRFLVRYQTLRDVKAGEELCISYGERLTFKDTDAPVDVSEGDGTDVLNSIQLDP